MTLSVFLCIWVLLTPMYSFTSSFLRNSFVTWQSLQRLSALSSGAACPGSAKNKAEFCCSWHLRRLCSYQMHKEVFRKVLDGLPLREGQLRGWMGMASAHSILKTVLLSALWVDRSCIRTDNSCRAFPTEIKGDFSESKTEATLGKKVVLFKDNPETVTNLIASFPELLSDVVLTAFSICCLKTCSAPSFPNVTSAVLPLY